MDYSRLKSHFTFTTCRITFEGIILVFCQQEDIILLLLCMNQKKTYLKWKIFGIHQSTLCKGWELGVVSVAVMYEL